MDAIALLSAKGGVGKTTAAVNLAALSAIGGRRTLLIDLDPQGASGHLLRIRASEGLKARRFWTGRAELDELIRASDIPGLDVLPAADSLRRAEAVLEHLDRPRRRLAGIVEGLDGWDRVIFDCPPGLGLLSENALRASDLVLVPVAPSPLALRTLAPLAELARSQAGRLRPFLSMDRGGDAIRKELFALWPASLASIIPLAEVVEESAVARLPVSLHAPRSRVALAYRKLLAEIDGILAAGRQES
jgi:chromosome partitioning protein